jgi:hypothetical protein
MLTFNTKPSLRLKYFPLPLLTNSPLIPNIAVETTYPQSHLQITFIWLKLKLQIRL